MQDYFFIRDNNRFVKIKIGEILYVESCVNYVKLITEKRTYMKLQTIGKMEELLADFDFCRVHRSFLISLSHLDSFDNEAAYIKDKIIPIGRYYRNKLKGSIKIVYAEKRDYYALKVAKSILAKGA